MFSTESDTTTSRQSSEAAGSSPAAGAHSPRRPSSSGVAAKKREQNAAGRKVYGQHSRAKLQKLQEKVKVHQQYVEESIKAQPPSTTLPPAVTSSAAAGTTMFPALSVHNDPGLALDFFMTPPEQYVSDCTSYRPQVGEEDALFNSFQLPTPYTYATPYPSWNMLPGAYDPQEPLTPGPSCSASDIMTGFTMEDAFCSRQNLQGLHADAGPQPPHSSPEYAGAAAAARGDNGAHTDMPDTQQARIRYLMEQAAAVGFETLDEAVAAYYTETFEDVPALYQEQRLSRNRRLPRLLNKLQSAAKGWSEWERRGFQEQITMGAEELLVQELNAFVKHQGPGASSSSSSSSGGGGGGNRPADTDVVRGRFGPTDNSMMRSLQVQNDLPNLWALTTALLARANPSRQESGSDTVLAIIETLCHGRGVVHVSGDGGLDRS